MGLSKKKEIDYNAIDCVIGENTTVKGDIFTKGGTHLSGNIEGNVKVEGDVFIAETSTLKGDVQGLKVVVSGDVTGNVVARTSLEITKSGKVNGDISAERLNIDDGASYNGKVTIGTPNASSPKRYQSSSQPKLVEESAEL